MSVAERVDSRIFGKNIVTFAGFDDYHPNTCLIYPQFVVDEFGKMSRIDENNFPDYGAIHMNLLNNYDCSELENTFSNVFVIRLSEEALRDREGYQKLYCNFRFDLNRTTGEVKINSLNSVGYAELIQVGSSLDELVSKKEIEFRKIYTKKIYIETRTDGKIYGPFEWEENDEGKINISGIQDYDFRIGIFSHNVIDQYSARVNKVDIGSTVIISDFGKTNPLELSEGSIDFITNNALLVKLRSILKKPTNGETFTREEISEIVLKAKKCIEDAQDDLGEERKVRLMNLVSNIDNIGNDSKSDIINVVLADEENRKKIVDYLKNNYELSNVVHEMFNDNETKAAILDYQKRNNIITTEKTQVVNLGEVTKLKDRIKELENKVEEARATSLSNGDLKVISSYQNRCLELQNECEKWSNHLKEIKKNVRGIVDEYKNEGALLSRIIDESLISEIMHSSDSSTPEFEESYPVIDASIIEEKKDGNSLIDRVYKYITDANRDLDRDDVINLLTCITNGFITTFAGSPGTGKTSLCNILANALGLARSDDKKRFVQIAVERGWTSHKDYIGYYNPLTKGYETSNPEFFNAIKVMDYEVCNDNNIAPYFVLLDEANLSPIEHYWSVFNRNCDLGRTKDRYITLGGNKNWMLSPNLRFLATINYDHTTEELSPRFLDRTWLVRLEPKEIDIEGEPDEIANKEKITSMAELNEFFAPKENDTMYDVLKNKWEKIRSIFASHNLAISPRNIRMVNDYCVVAQKYMSADEKYKPLDYAISEKILPTINGYGTRYEELCAELKSEFDNVMPRCYQIMEEIINNYDETGTYQFFN